MVLALLACGAATHLPTQRLEVGKHTVVAEIADEPQERSSGLMYRKSLGKDAGMLFVYANSASRSFWMKNTSIPLSIAFVSADGSIVNIEQMKPHDLNSTLSATEVPYALEMQRGWFESRGIVPGTTIKGLPSLPEQ